MNNQVLNISQMKYLAEIGVDTSKASMCWIKNTDGDETENKYMLSVHNEWCHEMSCLSPIPTFTLQDILDMLPKYVDNYPLRINIANIWVEYSIVTDGALQHNGLMTCGLTLIEAAFTMLCRLKQTGKLPKSV